MGYYWVAAEVLTGKIIADLPYLDVASVKQTIGLYNSCTATLPLPNAPVDWVRATTGGASNLILLADNPSDPSHGIPQWGGMVTVNTGTEGDTLALTLATIEAYFDRRFVGDATFTNVGQNDIINSLITNYVATGPNGGLPIRVQYVTAGAGALRTRSYAATDDKTVYSALTDLMGVIGGPEWSVGWEWQRNPERLTPVLYVGDRIGSAIGAGLGANAIFEMPGPLSALSYVQDYSTGKGANSVMAVSSGQGTTRPQSALMVFADPIRPTFEYRFTPSTSITDTDLLTNYATTAGAALDTGTASLRMAFTVTATTPALGIDWFLGDDVGFNISPRDGGGRPLPRFPRGFSGIARVIGWELSLGSTQTMTPTLAGQQIP